MDKNDPLDVHYLDKESGNIVILESEELSLKYCRDTYKLNCKNQKPETYTFVCGIESTYNQKMRITGIVYSVGLVISCIFLALTLLIYIALPPLRNLHGKTIMCHVASMLVAFSCLARVQWTNIAKGYCTVLGYIIYFSFLAAMSWLNVMCFDIWWTFTKIRTKQTIRQNENTMRFLRYSLFAWGVPIVLTIIVSLIDVYDVVPELLDPNFGKSRCWIDTSSSKTPLLIIFILPFGLQIVVNLVFFILTALYCNKVMSEMQRMQAGSLDDQCRRSFSADKAKYSMNLKLFIVMGVPWIMEIISTLISGPIELWYFTDAINILQGIPIFCILVLKKKIFHLMKKRLGLDKEQKEPKSDIKTEISRTSSEGRKSLLKINNTKESP